MIKTITETTTRSQLQKSNLLGGGRLWENDETMDKKRIKGRRGVTSWHNTAKSLRLSPVGKSDVCVAKQRVLTWGGPVVGNDGGKSAEIVVMADKSGAYRPFGSRVPQGARGSLKLETDQDNGMKDRTEKEFTNRAKDGRLRVSQTWPALPPRAFTRETDVVSGISQLIATGSYRRAARAGV
jgi:hypothetical protein